MGGGCANRQNSHGFNGANHTKSPQIRDRGHPDGHLASRLAPYGDLRALTGDVRCEIPPYRAKQVAMPMGPCWAGRSSVSRTYSPNDRPAAAAAAKTRRTPSHITIATLLVGGSWGAGIARKAGSSTSRRHAPPRPLTPRPPPRGRPNLALLRRAGLEVGPRAAWVPRQPEIIRHRPGRTAASRTNEITHRPAAAARSRAL